MALWPGAPVSLSPRIGRFPSNRVCAAQDGCSQARCLRHESIMARGSSHTKHSIQRHSLQANLQHGHPPTQPCNPTPVGPRATRPNQLTHPVHPRRRRQPQCASRTSLLGPAASKLLSVQFVSVPVPVPPCDTALLFHEPDPPGPCSEAHRACCLLACHEHILVQCSLLCSFAPRLDPVPAAIRFQA